MNSRNARQFGVVLLALALTAASLLSLLADLGSLGAAHSADSPKFSADVPAKITTPETVNTKIGTLNFRNGAPDDTTSALVYDNLDHMRGVQAFLRGMSASLATILAVAGMEEA